MARTRSRPRPTRAQTLVPVTRHCPECQQLLWADYSNCRTVTTLDAVTRLTLHIRRCPNPDCPRYHRPDRPEAEPPFALPHHEFGLAVVARVGRLRHAEHRSVPALHQALTGRGVAVAPRTVTNLLDRYDELKALSTADPKRRRPSLRAQRRVVLAIDGLQAAVGHEVLWVLRDCLSGDILLAKSLLWAKAKDLSALLREVRDALPVPSTGVVSDGQESIRNAVAQTLPGVPHQWCHFHCLREAATPIAEADRHAKKELKKRVRGVRPSERATEDEDDAAAAIVRGYCQAVRSALTDEGLPPLAASGLKVQQRLEQLAARLDRAQAKARTLPGGLANLRPLLRQGLPASAALWPELRVSYRWVKQVSRLLAHKAKRTAAAVRRRRSQILSRMRQAAANAQSPSWREPLRHFVKVSKSYWPGLFACSSAQALPRTHNDLEHLLGRHRYQERRARGRQRASPGLVVSGSVRVIASAATRLKPEEGLNLSPDCVARWQQRRDALEKRREARRQQRRFRREPVHYLKRLEELAVQLSLPP